MLLGLVSSGSHASYWWWFLYGRLHVVLGLLSGYFFAKSTNSDINVLLHKICSMLFGMLSLCCLVWSVVDHMVLIVSLWLFTCCFRVTLLLHFVILSWGDLSLVYVVLSMSSFLVILSLSCLFSMIYVHVVYM